MTIKYRICSNPAPPVYRNNSSYCEINKVKCKHVDGNGKLHTAFRNGSKSPYQNDVKVTRNDIR